MASIQGDARSPQLQIPRGSPARSITNSPSQLSTTCLVGTGDSASPSRKRPHPNYLKIDDAVPPNKKLSTPTKEEKETIMKEREELYKRLAQEKRSPFYLTPFPILPLNNRFSPMAPNLYSFIQHQQQQQHVAAANTQQTFPPSLTLSPSTDLLHSKLVPGLSVSSSTLMANSPGGNSSIVGNTAGISGLPTPGGSSVGTPPRPIYPYPASLFKFPFSPPTPSSLGLYSPCNRSASVGSAPTPGQPTTESGEGAGAGTGMLQCLNGSTSTADNSMAIATSTPNKNDTETTGEPAAKRLAEESTIESQILSPSSRLASQAPVIGTWPTIQSKPHLKSTSGLTSIQSPLGVAQTPYSPAMQSSPYPGSVSSCPSVSSSSGCSSASENQENPPGGLSLPPNFVLSEYHVGPHRLISEKEATCDQNEEATTSGRNTPVDPLTTTADSGCVLPSDVAQKLLSSQRGYSQPSSHQQSVITPSTSKNRIQSGKHHRSSAKPNSPHPFSVESMSSGYQPSPISQGYCHVMDRPSSGVSSMSSSLSSRDSTPDPDELKHDPNQPPQGADIFCLVPGRLSLLSSTQKYKVTVDEVRRRLSHPECLNASVLGGILRRAKSKNGGTVLRQRLQEIGVSLPPGRRKQTELSLLTSLVESEAMHLAGDFNRICDNYFPHAELGQMIARQHVGTPEAQPRISMVKATQLIVSELQAMLDAVGGPSTLRPNDPSNPYPGLTNFGLLSHGFGNPAINTGLGVLQTYLQELLAYYEGKKPIQPLDTNRYNMFSNESISQASSPQTSQESAAATSMHGGPSSLGHQQYHHHQHTLQNPLLYATRHYPSAEHQETVTTSSSEAEGGTVEVTLKEEPVESPDSYTV